MQSYRRMPISIIVVASGMCDGGRVRHLNHGEAGAIEALRTGLEDRTNSVIAPEIGERYKLPAGAGPRRLTTGRVDLSDTLNGDWQNAYADLAANLRRDLQRIETNARRTEALAQMRTILDSFAASRTDRKIEGPTT